MYERYYGVTEPPFKLTSNPRYLMLTSAHAEALNTVQYGISTRRGILVLIGEVGTGKTTIVRAAAAAALDGRFVHINNPLLTRSEFLHQLAEGFELGDSVAASKPRLVAKLTKKLEALARSGVQTALIVDEAHGLPSEILEEIRLLANLETDDEKLLPVVLVGQPELRDRLNEPTLRQLKQRVALRCWLGPLQMPETAAYIAGRIRVAGGKAERIFSREAVKLIHACSHGTPRTISVICDNAMVAGFAANEQPISADTVALVCADLDIELPATSSRRDRANEEPEWTFSSADARAVPPASEPSSASAPSARDGEGARSELDATGPETLSALAGGIGRMVRALSRACRDYWVAIHGPAN